MKRFIFEVIIVLLVALLPFYVLQGIIDKKAKTCYKPPYSSFNYIYNDTLNADVVIFGNSRAQCHYYGDLIDSLLDVLSNSKCNCKISKNIWRNKIMVCQNLVSVLVFYLIFVVYH